MKKYLFITAVIMLFFIVILTYTMPRPIDLNLNGYMYRVEDIHNSEIQKVNIRIEGKYTKHVFKENVFEGYIYVDGAQVYKNAQNYKLGVNFRDNWGLIYQSFYNEKSGKTVTLGEMFIDSKFKKVQFRVVESNTGSFSEGIVISAQADNITAARKINDELMKGFIK